MIWLLILGIVCLALGALFYWLNVNSPVQTFLPAIFFPVGLGALILALGGWLL